MTSHKRRLDREPEDTLRELEPIRCDEAVLEAALERTRRAAPERDLAGLPELPAPAPLLERSFNFVRLLQLSGSRSGGPGVLPYAAFLAASVLAVGMWLNFAADPQHDDGPLPPSSVVVVETLAGEVAVSRDGQLEALREGAHLRAGDTVITSANGALTLAIGEDAQLSVDDRSRLRLARVHGGVEFDVLQGRAEARVRAQTDDSNVGFAAPRGVVSVTTGRVGVLRLGVDRLVVAALEDSRLELDGAPLVMAAGQQTPLGTDLAPAPRAANPQVAVTMQQRRPLHPSDTELVIAGKTSPDVILVINDLTVPVDKEGEFIATVPVQKQTALVIASARDALGNEHRATLAVLRAKTHTTWQPPP